MSGRFYKLNTIRVTVENSEGTVVKEVYIPERFEESLTSLLEEMKR